MLGIEKNRSLKPLTTFKIGGPRAFLQTSPIAPIFRKHSNRGSAEDARLVLGGGSNMLVSDRGFEGLVVSGFKSRH